MLSQFFVLSPRGDTIISKDYRGDSPPGAAEAFFRKCREERSCPPCFRINDVTYVWVKQHGLMFVCNTRFNASPSTIIELLNRLVKVFKDYCGVLSEEAIRKNFILIYELLDEIVDFGYPQGTSTENLKACVYNEPLLVDAQKMRVPSLSTKTVSSSAVHKPIGSRKTGMMGQSGAARNEIFVDILERLTMLFAANGSVVNSTIDGCIQMKSYLAGNPELRLALNEDLVAHWYMWLNRREPGTDFENLQPLGFETDDLRILRWYGVEFHRDEHCPVCGNGLQTLITHTDSNQPGNEHGSHSSGAGTSLS